MDKRGSNGAVSRVTIRAFLTKCASGRQSRMNDVQANGSAQQDVVRVEAVAPRTSSDSSTSAGGAASGVGRLFQSWVCFG